MKGKLLRKAVSLAAAVAMAVTGFSAVPVSADEESIDYEEFFASAGGVKQVSLGNAHSAAITMNGDLYTWGNNDHGQLGNGTKTNSSTPIKIMSNVKYINLGNSHSAAITENGDLYTWGDNLDEQLGYHTSDNEPNAIPRKLMSNVVSVDLGAYHSAAITTNGDLYTWGNNDWGQLGNNSSDNSAIPEKIMSNVSSVSLGDWHSAAITTNGDLYTWGKNYDGQLGNGVNNESSPNSSPQKIMSEIAFICLGQRSSAAISQSNDLYIWGFNGNEKISGETTYYSAVPIKIMSNITSVSLGECYICVIDNNGDLYTRGINARGALGNGAENISVCTEPTKIMSNVSDINSGLNLYNAAITTNGDLYTWGYNYFGQLGNGTTKDVLVPTKVDFFKGTETPASPKITKAVAGDGQVALNWTSVTGATQYAVYTYVNSKWTLAGKTTALGMYVRGLKNGTKYGFAVKAYVNRAWTGITSSDIVYATPATIATKPKITKTIPGNGQVGLNWSQVSGATQYAVYYKTGSTWTLAGKTTALGMYVRGLANGTKYGFAVKAYVNRAWTGITSSDIVYASPTAPVTKPVITKTIVGDGQVGLNWTSVSGAKQYAVYYRNGSTWTLAGKTTSIGMYVRGLTNGTKYGFAVKAYVNGAWTTITSSDIVYATPTAAKSSIIDIDPEDIELFDAVPVIA